MSAIAEIAPLNDVPAALAELDQPMLDVLPIGVCFFDREGRILRANRTARELWGSKTSPFDTVQRLFGSFRMQSLDGAPIAAEQWPMAQAIRDGAQFRNFAARIENPDGRRWIASINVQPLRDGYERISGAVSCFQDVTEAYGEREAMARQQKCFDLAMTASKMGTWRYTMADNICIYDDNAQRLYGLTEARFLHDAEQVRNKFHPDDMELMWSRVAKAIDPRGDGLYDVEYRVKQPDGSWRWLSAWGYVEFEGEGEAKKPVAITGASRDISDRAQADEAQRLLIGELHHRVKNLFALASGVVTLSARAAASPTEMARAVSQRLGALARAHALTLPSPTQKKTGQAAMLHALIATIVSPLDGKTLDGRPRISIAGSDVSIAGPAVTSFALLLHEFATNAAKYGALSLPTGHVEIESFEQDDKLVLTWRERGGPRLGGPILREGFGTFLTRMTVEGQLGGEIARDWQPDGLCIRLSVERARLS